MVAMVSEFVIALIRGNLPVSCVVLIIAFVLVSIVLVVNEIRE